jgi:putative transposase
MGLRNKALYDEKNIFFITTTCNKWMELLTVGNSMSILSHSLNFCSHKYHAKILGYVFMPNHIHLIIYFEHGSYRSDFMRDFKKYTSTKIRNEIVINTPSLKAEITFKSRDQLFKVWMDRFDELYLDSQSLLEDKLEYIHNNPLQEKWSLVAYQDDYIYSSAGFYYKGTQGCVSVDHYVGYI